MAYVMEKKNVYFFYEIEYVYIYSCTKSYNTLEDGKVGALISHDT